MKINKASTFTAIGLMSVYITGWQIISNNTASATPANLPAKSLVAQNNTICSFINANNVNVRNGPGERFKVVTKLNRGDIVKAVRKQGKWVQISAKVTSEAGVTPEVTKPLRGWVQNTFINGCSEDQFEMWRS